MRIIDVLPIIKGFNTEELSYFTIKEVPLGSLVSVPIRNRKVNAIVLRSHEVSDSKMSIKKASFELKKLDKITSKNFFLEGTIRAAHKAGKHFLWGTGNILSTITPSVILDAPKEQKILEKKADEIGAEKFLFQATDEDRFLEYRGIIRESFAKNESVMMLVPTIEEADKLSESIKRGIEDFTIVLHSGLTPSTIKKSWDGAIKNNHPVLLIITGAFLSIPRSDIGTIIIEKEGSKFYKTRQNPKIDIRTVVEILAKEYNARLIFADSCVRIETLSKMEEGEIMQFPSTKFHLGTQARVEIVDMSLREDGIRKESPILSRSLISLIEETIENRGRILLFATRRGYSPTTICGDCGNTVLCRTCGAPTILHLGKSSNHFLCHVCGERRDANEICKSCGSWNLKAFGIGTESVSVAVKEKFPDAHIFEFSSDTIKNMKAGKEMMEKFMQTGGGIMIGTEQVLYYLSKKVENSAIVSIDSLFAIPDFRGNERIFSIITNMRTYTKEKFILQSRNASSPTLSHAIRGSSMDFYREEMAKRRLFNWPPFNFLIKISSEGKKKDVTSNMQTAEKELKEYEFDIFPAFIPKEKGNVALSAILRLDNKFWPNEKLSNTLNRLQGTVNIEVDPATIF